MNWLRVNRIDVILMGVLLGAGIGFLVPDLAHDSIWSFDESFHQVVVRHVYEHPFYHAGRLGLDVAADDLLAA